MCPGHRLDRGDRRAASAKRSASTAEPGDWDRCKPVYEQLPGWKQDLSGIRKYSDLPANARRYLDRMAELAGAKISLVGIGPDREQTLEA